MLWGRIGLALILAALLVWLLLPGHVAWPPLAILGLNLPILGLIHLHWRRWAYAVDGQRMRIRSGLFGQKIVEFDLASCQQVAITASPYQRRHQLGSLTIRLPHGEVAIPYLARAAVDDIANLLVYRAESSAEHSL